MTQTEAPLSEYFDAVSKGTKWHLFCKKCGRGWELPKDNEHVGNTLHLLNHARSHAQIEPKKNKRQG
jgi:hypothetical protein